MKTAHHELLRRHHCNLELFAVQRVRDEATVLFGRRCAIECFATLEAILVLHPPICFASRLDGRLLEPNLQGVNILLHRLQF